MIDYVKIKQNLSSAIINSYGEDQPTVYLNALDALSDINITSEEFLKNLAEKIVIETHIVKKEMIDLVYNILKDEFDRISQCKHI